MTRWLSLVLVLAGLGMLAGCAPTGVGDPCTPENEPEGGYVIQEAYLETSSVQCRTRVCIVYGMEGSADPAACASDPAHVGQPDCQGYVDDRVYCSCRCKAPAGVDTPTCECPDGFECVEILETGTDGIRGSYCVNSRVADELL